MKFKFKTKKGTEIEINIHKFVIISIINVVAFKLTGSMELLKLITNVLTP